MYIATVTMQTFLHAVKDVDGVGAVCMSGGVTLLVVSVWVYGRRCANARTDNDSRAASVVQFRGAEGFRR